MAGSAAAVQLSIDRGRPSRHDRPVIERATSWKTSDRTAHPARRNDSHALRAAHPSARQATTIADLAKPGRRSLCPDMHPRRRIRTGKDCGIGRFPSQAMAMNKAWFAAALIAATLLAWLRLLALDGSLARAEPKTLRYKILHAAARITRGARRRHLKIQASWPWAADIAAAWDRISALAHAP
jgi:hypothetical protein